MSNKSYSFKENSYVIVNQGGEKKVMKKILSVALSTAMAFSMFATVAFGADAKLTPEQQFNALKDAGIVEGFPDGLSHLDRSLTRAELAKIITKATDLTPVDATSYTDKNYAKHWARTYIEAVTQAGIMEGKNLEKKLFDPSGNLSVQELAAVLVRALKLEVPTDANNTATEWAKGYVEAAVKGGYIDAGINYQANASRSQAIVAAYAIYQDSQLKVAKAEAIDATHVKLTLSTGEVVDVTLEKALEANKATELEYTTKDGKVLKYTVTYVVTAATKVESVSAENLKQITVKFDGEVDKATAGNKANYKINKDIDSVSIADDARSVVLTLGGEYASDSNKLVNQVETKLTVDGVKSSDKARTLKQEVKFTPVDVTTPSVKEVVGLGTKAIKVVFSEPVDRASASNSSNYKIDGKSIAAYIDYAFPNSVIITTENAIGDHKLTVSNVQDFSGLKVVPVENDFKVAEDTEAPTVVSAKSYDLTKVEIEFNEPLKSVGKIYNGVSSKAGTVKLDRASNKVTVTFEKDKALSVGENTIVIEGATDYSGNSANREVKVTPELDVTKPEVNEVSVSVNSNNNHVLKVKYSKPVYDAKYNTTGVKQSNYTVKDKDGKVVVGKGLDGSGHPVRAIAFNSDNDEATIELSGKLDKGTYTLEVSGVQDNAYVPNTIIPVSQSFTIGDTSEFKVNRFWFEEQSKSNSSNKRDVYFFVTFSKSVATEGLGSAVEVTKYNVNWGKGKGYEALPTDSGIELVTPNTVKITVPYTDKEIGTAADVQLRVSLVADADGNYLNANNGNIQSDIPVSTKNIETDGVEATAKDTIKVKFTGKLVNVDANEFQLRSTSVTTATYDLRLDSLNTDGGNTVATFVLTNDKKIDPKADVKFEAKGTAAANGVVTTSNTKDQFGVPVSIDAAGVTVGDKIKPSVVKPSDAKPFVLSQETQVADGFQYTASIKFDEAISVVQGTGVVKVSVTGTDLVTSSYAPTTDSNVLLVTFVTKDKLGTGEVVSVELDASNSNAKAITDASSNKNTADAFTLYGVVSTLQSN